MKKIIGIGMFMVLFVSYGLCQSVTTLNAGRDADVWTVWVGTTPYKLISGDYAGTYTGYTAKSLAGTFWTDFDTTVSTWNTSRSANETINGYVTGEDWKTPVNGNFRIDGLLGVQVYVVSDLTTGCTIQIMVNKIY